MERREELDPARCAAVWKRVAPELDPYPEARGSRETKPPGGGGAEAALREALEEALAARRDYLARARSVGGAAGRTLEELARGSGQQLRRLRGLCYLLTGERWQPREAPAPAEAAGLCAFLRSRYGAEAKAAARYEAWAGETEDPCLAAVLRRLAEDSRSRAATVLQLLENRLAQ
ncbi:MAG: hypothetical protein IJL08_04215 [Oscillospiraceae bacterium]|nr:hypothetical protein [Oscillospiraceae bacterium]